MLLENHYQNAYVTPDIDRAVELLADRFGVTFTYQAEMSTPVRTPAGEGVSHIKMALGWVGALQYELIQPLSGAVDIYRDAVRIDEPLTLHHVAMRAPDWEALRAEIARRGLPVVLEGQSERVKFAYVDARDVLGHYLEYMWTDPQTWAAMGGR